MAEPTQAGAAAACPGPPRSCPHSGSCLGPPSPLQPQWLHGPSVGWDPTGIAPPAPGASVGSPWGWESVRCWRGWGKRRGPCSAVPAMPALLPAAVLVPCLRGRRKSPRALGLQLCHCCERWGSGAVGHKLQSTGCCCALLYCSGCCAAVLQGRGGCAAPRGAGRQQFGGCSPHPHALVLPVPAFTLAVLWTSPCGAGMAGTLLVGAGGPGSCGLRRGRRAVGELIGSARASELRGSPRVGPEPVLRQEG